MNISDLLSWEIPLMQIMQSIECSITNVLAILFTLLGEVYFVLIFVGLCYWNIDKKLGRNISLSLTGAILFGSMLHWVFQRRRPYMDYSEIKCIRAPFPEEDVMSVAAQGFSCPSLHSAHNVSLYGTLSLNVKKPFTVVLAFVIPFLIGVSRVYLGVHYPTDVMFGWVLGAIVLVAFYYIEKKFGYKVCYIIQLAVGSIGFLYCRDNEFFSIYGVILGLFLGFCYEEKFVKFEMNKNWWGYVLRPLIAAIIFAVVSLILKFPVKYLFVDQNSIYQFLYRLFRYAVSTFIIIGLYPHLFNKIKFL